MGVKPLFKTRITDLFGIQHPLLCGGMMWLSDARLVAAVVNAGAMAFMTPRSFPSADAYRAELALCRELTGGKPFGVNLTISSRIESNLSLGEHLDIALEEGVRYFETAGAHPGELIDRIHRSGGVVIHKASEIRHAQAAEQAGADAVALVGMEAGGHPGRNDLPASVLGAFARDRIRCPLALGGAIGSGRQIIAMLAQGADAVVLGSRLVVAEEVWAHPAYKQRLIECDENCSTTAMRSYNATWRVLDNATAREVQRLERNGASYEELGELATGRYGRDHCYRNGDWERGMLSMSAAAGFADAIVPVAEIMAALMAEAEDYLDRLDRIRIGGR